MNKTDNIYSTIRSAKFVLKPTSKQKEILESFFGLSRAIQDVSWSSIVSKLDYKIAENQGKIVKIDRFYPSSKTCSNCGYVKDKLLLSERTYHCEECGLTIDRDLNASINILNVGLKQIEATAAMSGTSLKN